MINCQQAQFLLNQIKALKSELEQASAIEYLVLREQREEVWQLQQTIVDLLEQLKQINIISLEQAKVILGTDHVYGPKEIQIAFGNEIPITNVPPIPYSRAELKKAKHLGEKLILRIGHDQQGRTINFKHLREIVNLVTQTIGSPIIKTDFEYSYSNSDFYTRELLKTEWVLVGDRLLSPDPIQTSDLIVNPSYNCLKQTQTLRDYLLSIDQLTKEEAQECSDEKLQALAERIGMDWQTQEIIDWNQYFTNKASVFKELFSLKINDHHRRKAVEILYDWLLEYRNDLKGYPLNNVFDCSGSILEVDSKTYSISISFFPRSKLLKINFGELKQPSGDYEVGVIPVR